MKGYEKCEAIVYESAGRGGLGYARACMISPKWIVDGRMFCTIHKNVEVRLDRRVVVQAIES